MPIKRTWKMHKGKSQIEKARAKHIRVKQK